MENEILMCGEGGPVREAVRSGPGVRSTVLHGPRSDPVHESACDGSARFIFGRKKDRSTVEPDHGRPRSGPVREDWTVRSISNLYYSLKFKIVEQLKHLFKMEMPCSPHSLLQTLACSTIKIHQSLSK
jgi:hypothetical protein